MIKDSLANQKYVLENTKRAILAKHRGDLSNIDVIQCLIFLQNLNMMYGESTTSELVQSESMGASVNIIREGLKSLPARYSLHPYFVIEDLETLLLKMGSGQYSFDNKPSDIKNVLEFLDNFSHTTGTDEQRRDFRIAMKGIDQFSKSFLSDATFDYLLRLYQH